MANNPKTCEHEWIGGFVRMGQEKKPEDWPAIEDQAMKLCRKCGKLKGLPPIDSGN